MLTLISSDKALPLPEAAGPSSMLQATGERKPSTENRRVPCGPNVSADGRTEGVTGKISNVIAFDEEPGPLTVTSIDPGVAIMEAGTIAITSESLTRLVLRAWGPK